MTQFNAFKKEYKKKAEEKGIRVSYPRSFNGIRIQHGEGINKFEVSSEANIQDDELVINRLEFGTHGSYDYIHSTKWIIEFWINYAIANSITKIKFTIRMMDGNRHGGWRNELRIAEALSLGFKVMETTDNQYGIKDYHYLSMSLPNYNESKELSSAIFLAVDEMKDSTLSVNNGNYDVEDGCDYPSLSLKINWEGFLGDVHFYQTEIGDWFEITHQPTAEIGVVEFEKYFYTIQNVKERFKLFLDELKEKMALVNLIHPPTENLHKLIDNFVSVDKEQTTESIMHDFIQVGYAYNEIESEALRIIEKGLPNSYDLNSNPNKYKTEHIMKLNILQGTDIVFKIFSHYLVCFSNEEFGQRYTIAEDENGIIEFFSDLVSERVNKMFKL